MSSEAEIGATAREQQVLGLLSEGLANKEIADALGCSVRTVEFHISNLLRKAGVSSRLELVARGRRPAAALQELPSPVNAPLPLNAPLPVNATAEPPLIEIRLYSGAAIALLGDTAVAMWSAGATAERWAWKRAVLDERIAAHEAGVLCLSLVLDTSSPPDARVRAQMKADFHRFGTKLRRFVVVPLGNSMWMSIVRTIGQAVLFLSGRSRRQTLASSLDDGLTRLEEAAGPSTPTRAELEVAVAELSRLLGVAGPSVNKKAG